MIPVKLLNNTILLKIFGMILKFPINYNFKNYVIALLLNLIQIRLLFLVKLFFL